MNHEWIQCLIELSESNQFNEIISKEKGESKENWNCLKPILDVDFVNVLDVQCTLGIWNALEWMMLWILM